MAKTVGHDVDRGAEGSDASSRSPTSTRGKLTPSQPLFYLASLSEQKKKYFELEYL